MAGFDKFVSRNKIGWKEGSYPNHSNNPDRMEPPKKGKGKRPPRGYRWDYPNGPGTKPKLVPSGTLRVRRPDRPGPQKRLI